MVSLCHPLLILVPQKYQLSFKQTHRNLTPNPKFNSTKAGEMLISEPKILFAFVANGAYCFTIKISAA